MFFESDSDEPMGDNSGSTEEIDPDELVQETRFTYRQFKESFEQGIISAMVELMNLGLRPASTASFEIIFELIRELAGQEFAGYSERVDYVRITTHNLNPDFLIWYYLNLAFLPVYRNDDFVAALMSSIEVFTVVTKPRFSLGSALTVEELSRPTTWLYASYHQDDSITDFNRRSTILGEMIRRKINLTDKVRGFPTRQLVLWYLTSHDDLCRQFLSAYPTTLPWRQMSELDDGGTEIIVRTHSNLNYFMDRLQLTIQDINLMGLFWLAIRYNHELLEWLMFKNVDPRGYPLASDYHSYVTHNFLASLYSRVLSYLTYWSQF
jgi:hypothetical protein